MSKHAKGKKRGHKSQGRAVEESQRAWRFGGALLTPRDVEQRRREVERMRRWAKAQKEDK